MTAEPVEDMRGLGNVPSTSGVQCAGSRHRPVPLSDYVLSTTRQSTG